MDFFSKLCSRRAKFFNFLDVNDFSLFYFFTGIRYSTFHCFYLQRDLSGLRSNFFKKKVTIDYLIINVSHLKGVWFMNYNKLFPCIIKHNDNGCKFVNQKWSGSKFVYTHCERVDRKHNPSIYIQHTWFYAYEWIWHVWASHNIEYHA